MPCGKNHSRWYYIHRASHKNDRFGGKKIMGKPKKNFYLRKLPHSRKKIRVRKPKK